MIEKSRAAEAAGLLLGCAEERYNVHPLQGFHQLLKGVVTYDYVNVEEAKVFAREHYEDLQAFATVMGTFMLGTVRNEAQQSADATKALVESL